jgi:glycosyltransferase involved in cell wall biosynthesis
MEQALGHVAYTKNLQTAFGDGRLLAPVWMPVPFAAGGPLDRLPPARSNWAIRGSLRAQAVLHRRGGPRRFDALFYNTQTVALLAPLAARSVPVILSLDATPLNFDSVGAAYDHHAAADSRAERLKQALYRRVFHRAAALTTWSQWAKDSLRDDYGVDPDLVTVIPPGTDLELFPFGTQPRAVDPERKVRVLFVGGDFERKGGRELLAAMRAGLAERCELYAVTKAPVPATPGVHVYNDLGPNDPRLVALYRDADIFALPTHADCLAVVLGEAMAAGLPIITTNVAAQPEAVRDGVSGLVITPGDVDALGRALRRLADDPDLRRSMGAEGRKIAESRFDTRRNAERLARVITEGIARCRVTTFVPEPTLTPGPPLP